MILKNDTEKFSNLVNKGVTKQLNKLNDKIISEGIETGTPILAYGSYADKIVYTSDKINTSLLIIGSGEKLKNDAFQLGSTAEKIVRRSNKPVFVIKNNQTLDVENIICPVDFSKESSRALSSAIVISRLFGAKLVILSVYSLVSHHPFIEYDSKEINEQKKLEHSKEFNKFLEGFDLIDLNYIKEIKGGEPAEEILNTISSYKSDLLLMGTTGKSGISRFLMGSVTEKVVRRVLCSFITLKNEHVITLEIEEKIRNIENHYNTAQELFEKGFFKEAINQFNICIDINYAHLPSLIGIAKVYEKLGDVNNAKRYREMVKNVLDQIQNLKIEEEARKQAKI